MNKWDMFLKVNKAAYLRLSHFEDFNTNTVLVSYKKASVSSKTIQVEYALKYAIHQH